MELSDFTIITAVSLLTYILGANHKQYIMAKDWLDSHQKCDISFYEDWIQNAEYFCRLNYINTYVGKLGRHIAYKLHSNKNN